MSEITRRRDYLDVEHARSFDSERGASGRPSTHRCANPRATHAAFVTSTRPLRTTWPETVRASKPLSAVALAWSPPQARRYGACECRPQVFPGDDLSAHSTVR